MFCDVQYSNFIQFRQAVCALHYQISTARYVELFLVHIPSNYENLGL